MIALSVWAWALSPQIAAPLSVFGALWASSSASCRCEKATTSGASRRSSFGGVFGVPLGVFAAAQHRSGALSARHRGVADALRRLWPTAGGGTAHQGGRQGLDAFIGLIGGVLGGLGGMSGAVPRSGRNCAAGTATSGARRCRSTTSRCMSFTLTLYCAHRRARRDRRCACSSLAPAMIIPGYFGARLYGGFSEKAFTRLILACCCCRGSRCYMARLSDDLAQK